MSDNMYQDQDFTDILFQNKNKAYGAYQLRKAYKKYLSNSFGITLTVYVLAIFIPFAINKFKAKPADNQSSKKVKIVQYSQLSAPPPIERKKPSEPKIEKPKPKTVKYVEPVVKPDDEVIEEEEFATQDELMDVDAGLETLEGEDSVVVEDFEMEEPPEPEPEPEPKPEPHQPFDFVEMMPTFPGGELKFMKYLNQNIEYPRLARDNGIQGRVVLQFVVDETGCVKDVKVVKGVGMGCDKEAIRVLLGSPTWVAGKQGGNDVPVRMYVNVDFKLE